MDSLQQEALLRAVAVSSLQLPQTSDAAATVITREERRAAFVVLEDFKKYDGRIPVVLNWLQSSDRVLYQNQYDITIATKLLALETLSSFLQKGNYSNISDNDRVSLRQAVLKSAQVVASSSSSNSSEDNNNTSAAAGSRILAKKLAAVLEAIVIRDFPQRWTSLANDVFAPINEGGLWFSSSTNNNNNNNNEQQHQSLLGVSIVLECLKLVAEDCTDSDFNAKISTKRRNDVLIGLNEVSDVFLPLLYRILEQSYPILQQSKATLFSMHQYLISTGRNTSSMTADEAAMYRKEVRQQNETATLLSDTLLTLEKFCSTMPVGWMMGTADSKTKIDFVAAMMHLLRERQANIQIRAVECIEIFCMRGKLEYDQWMRLIRELPNYVNEANQVFVSEQEQRTAERMATTQQNEEPPFAVQLPFHRALARMLAYVVSTHLAHITTNKHIAKQKGQDYDGLRSYLRLLVDILHHPSGRMCTEQVNMWVSMLRDPQIVRTNILEPFLLEIMTCYMEQLVRIRWTEDVENGTHPSFQVLEASFDDEDEYDSWMGDLRSRSSMLFKMIGNVDPKVASGALLARLQKLLEAHGNGQPLNYLDPTNNQLTQKSDAVLIFEGMYQPLENTLNGIPAWALEPDASKARRTDARSMSIRDATRRSLSEVANALVAWNPTYLWLKFRRASLLETLKYVWLYDPSTLLQGVDSLLRYLGLPDEWKNTNQVATGTEQGTMSPEIVSLKKKSGVTLVSVSKRVPQHLVPWLSQLSEATSALLSSQGLIPLNQMHLFEFLSCVAASVEDPRARSDFISNVLSNAVETLESAEIQQSIVSVPSLLSMFGVTDAQPESVTNPVTVNAVTSRYNKLFTALNRLLSVGRRCNEAARKRIHDDLARIDSPPDSGFGVPAQLNFPDEGPVEIQKLAEKDPFVPLWPRILPPLLRIYEVTLSIWRPEHQAVLLKSPVQRYVYAISDDEAYLAKTQDSKSAGGVFGEGGTAGSVVSGVSRRDVNIVPKWSGWLNELRNTCFQMLGLLAAQRVLFAPDIANHFPRLVAVLTDPLNLRSMEHRHLTQFLKHVVEMTLLSCPSTMYTTHLAPIIGPIFEHMRFRLEKSWLPIIGESSHQAGSGESATKALKSVDTIKAAALASQGGEVWFTWYYGHAGLFVGDLDDVTAESAVEKYRVEIGRAYSDVLQACLALKGDWSLVLANQAKEEQALKRNDLAKLSAGPANRLNDDGLALNADGTPKLGGQALIDARKLRRINGICHFLLLENEQIAGNLVMTVIQCLGYPDQFTVRRMTKICHRILETVAWSPQYSQLLGQHMFTQAVKNTVTEPKWMVGMEWDMINVVRDIYCRLVLGQTLQFGGQGAGQQQLVNASSINGTSAGANQYEQAKTADRPLLGGGILTTASDYPRQVLASLPGIAVTAVTQLESEMKQNRSAKEQKDIIRDLLRQGADFLKETDAKSKNGATSSAAGSLFDRAIEEESLLHYRRRSATVVPDLPEKLITRSQVNKALQKQNDSEPIGLTASIFES